MAGFFIYSTRNENISTRSVNNAFIKKGLKEPKIFKLGEYTLLLYSKIVEDEPNYYQDSDGFCMAVGSYIYKTNDYSGSLSETYKDYLKGELSLKDMYGQYTLLIYYDGKIIIVSDALFAKHIFSDKDHNFFTSSLFAAVSAVNNVTLNRNAIFEKILTGIIISPDTIVNEIIKLNREEQEKYNIESKGISFIIHPRIELKPFHKKKRESVRSQASRINEYFSILSKGIRSDRVDLGLSAGHDSSLLFAAINERFHDQLHLHTHSTGTVHNHEKNAAILMAKKKNFDITVIPTPRLDEDGIELQKFLLENLEFFDGRTSHDIGGFSATYRLDYRVNATDACKTSITGVGGECLRNHYSVVGKTVQSDRFFRENIFNNSFIESIDRRKYEEIKKFHIDKAEKILALNLKGKVKRINLRRYYSEVLMPEGQGNVIDAYNMVSRCFAPFLESFVLTEAYRGIEFLGNCGEYESAIISTLDSEVGSCINANNGFPFDHLPMKIRIKEYIRARVSKGLWEYLHSLKIGNAKSSQQYLENVINKSDMLSEAFVLFKKEFPEINIDNAVKGYAMDATIEYLVLTIWRIRNRK